LNATQALQYSPTGELLATAAGKVVTLWTASGNKVHAFAAASSTAVALAFDKPGTDLGVALNGEIAVHRIEKSRYETRRYKWPAPCLTVNFSGNGRFLASGMADGSLHFWNRSTGKDSQMRGYDGRVQLVGWSDNSRYLATSAGNEVVLWDFSGRGPEGTRPVVLNGHTERVDCFAWQPGGEHLVSGGRDWRLNLWRPGKSAQAIDVQMTDSEISVVRWSADGKRVAVGEKQGRVSIFDLVAR
jgi:WD40 repeat protein